MEISELVKRQRALCVLPPDLTSRPSRSLHHSPIGARPYHNYFHNITGLNDYDNYLNTNACGPGLRTRPALPPPWPSSLRTPLLTLGRSLCVPLCGQAPPEFDYYASYLNQPQVRAAIHVGNASFPSDPATCEKHLLSDFMVSFVDELVTLLEAEDPPYKVLIYSGQLDVIACCPRSNAP